MHNRVVGREHGHATKCRQKSDPTHIAEHGKFQQGGRNQWKPRGMNEKIPMACASPVTLEATLRIADLKKREAVVSSGTPASFALRRAEGKDKRDRNLVTIGEARGQVSQVCCASRAHEVGLFPTRVAMVLSCRRHGLAVRLVLG